MRQSLREVIVHDSIEYKIRAAQESLFAAVKLSHQGAYHRRAPDPECLQYYHEASRLLNDVLDEIPINCEALVMMSRINEGLMDFDKAIHFLNKAFEAGEPRTKKSLKRLALLHENKKAWQELVLTPGELRELGEYLEVMGVGPANRTLEFTREWLSLEFEGDAERVIAGLDERGAFSDFQVLANVIHG